MGRSTGGVDTEKEYRATVNLPRTDFPMRGDLPHREPEIHKFWDEIDLYQKSLDKPAPKGRYILHDGPPYSNGDVHVGNAMQNKLPKDFITKYRSMRGYYAPYIPGWDNHGLPIENNVAAEFRKAGKTASRLEIRQRCREYAAHWVDVQRKQYQRLGIRGDWDNPYLTMAHDFEAAEVKVFADLALGGYIYRGLRPIYWCMYDETALADAEIEYEMHTSPSIYVRFGLKHDPETIFGEHPIENCYAVIWTTTPWTIPANLALAAHPDFEYVVVETGGDRYIVAKELLYKTLEAVGASEHRIIKTVNGRKLDGLVFQHPLYERESPVVFAEYVTTEEGTGIVHTAPGHGREDFATGQAYSLDVLNPVDSKGYFTEEAGQFAGLHILKQGNSAVVDVLRESGALMAETAVEHSYPHCWRCHNPVVFRTTVQWFLNMEHNDLRGRILNALNHVDWVPAESINRMRALMEGAPDWCLSRQRSWGIGIPAFFCNSCHDKIMNEESLGSVVRLVEEQGSDAWFEVPAEKILPAGFKCPNCGGTSFTKEQDILDVWFDSGSTWHAVVEARPELDYPADLYYEGYDQFKAWFGKSLIVSMAVKDQAPYKQVAAHGFVVDALGRAMHKSRGNVVKTTDVTAKFGADIIRLAAASFDVFSDAKLSDEVLQRSTDAYRRIRNTFRFLLSNLYDFDPCRDAVEHARMLEIDRWILHRLQDLVREVTSAFDSFEFHRVFHLTHNFCAVDLSSLYLDILKDRLYASAARSPERRSAQTAMYELLSVLVRLLAPVISHTTEEVWRYIPGRKPAESVLLADFPEVNESYIDEPLAERWQRLIEVRDEVYRHIEQARQSGVIGKPLESKVTVEAPAETYKFLRSFEADLPSVFIVSQVELRETAGAMKITIAPPEGQKCERCWLVLTTVGGVPEHPNLCERCAAVVVAE